MMEQMPLPTISAHQLSAEAAAHLKQFKDFAILHLQLAQVDRQLTRAIEEPAGFAYVLLYGPSGAGKTTVLRQVERRYTEMAASSTPRLLASLSHLGHLPSVPLLEGRKYSGSRIGIVLIVFRELLVFPLVPFFPAFLQPSLPLRLMPHEPR